MNEHEEFQAALDRLEAEMMWEASKEASPEEDPLGPARGLVIGLLGGLLFWVVVFEIAIWTT